MFYYVTVRYVNENKFISKGVGCVWAIDNKHALKKGLALYGHWEILSISIDELELDTIKNTATIGGMTLASFEETI